MRLDPFALITQVFFFERDSFLFPIEDVLSFREATLKLTLLVPSGFEFFIGRFFSFQSPAISVEKDFVCCILGVFFRSTREEFCLSLLTLQLLPANNPR